ncbi:MAG: hypothetical protein OEU74_05205 [Gammaproteobacteria bacterium]|nr:hypothetical protein [Gammaproteobacteria bacterium]
MKLEIVAAVKSLSLIVIALGGLCSTAFCQEKHNDVHSEHESGGMEVGLSVGYAYLKEDKEEGVNLHLHLMKRLSGEGLQKYFSIGIGAETIIADEKHYAAMFSLAAHPTRNLVLSVSPGVEWAKHEGKWESEYATHIEAAYIFEGPDFHYGPAISYSKAKDEQHYAIGIHIGVPL